MTELNTKYLKIGKATELSGRDFIIYRLLEILPGFLSWATLLTLIILSYLRPEIVAYFIIAFDVYWFLLVFFLGIHLIASYRAMTANMAVDWKDKCTSIVQSKELGISWSDVIHLIVLPTYNESFDVIKATFEAIIADGYPTDKMILVLAIEERGGEEIKKSAQLIEQEFGRHFKHFLITTHPDGMTGELKGKGANQAWAAREVQAKIIDQHHYNYDHIIASVFDIDTIVIPGYFYCLTHKFLTVPRPHRASYQPIPIYHNNIWQAPFFARIAASSNTFWQMMQQIRAEKLATYSSHSMSWKALVDVGFWSTNMVSEDSRIFWHCLSYYKGDYRVEPLYFPVSMDICMDDSAWKTMRNLYKQQRRWGWGVENVPYLIFNTIKNWDVLDRKEMIKRILVQLYGFHSWATNALIIGAIGWLPILIGGGSFNSTVLANNLPVVTKWLMMFAMGGMVLSAIISSLLLPKVSGKHKIGKTLVMALQWLILPVIIVIFGAVPGLEAQTRLMFGKYLGFFVTPKSR